MNNAYRNLTFMVNVVLGTKEMKSLKTALLISAMMIGGMTVAHADVYGSPVSGTFNIAIYQGTGDGTSSAPIEQANSSNPLFSTKALAMLTYTGPLNLSEPGGGANQISNFLTSGGGSYTVTSGSITGDQLSTAPFALTTLFSITGTGYAGQAGYVSHDDGASLYQGGKTIFDSAGPTVDTPTAYTLTNSGAFNLVYVEANGLPANLTMSVPEPGSLALLGTAMLGLALVSRRRNRV